MLVDDESGSAMRSYGLTYFPFSVLVDGSGTVVTRHVGSLSGADIETAISALRAQG